MEGETEGVDSVRLTIRGFSLMVIMTYTFINKTMGAPEKCCCGLLEMPVCTIDGRLQVLADRDTQCDSQGRSATKMEVFFIIKLETRGLLLWFGRLHFNSFCVSLCVPALFLNSMRVSRTEVLLEPSYVTRDSFSFFLERQ